MTRHWSPPDTIAASGILFIRGDCRLTRSWKNHVIRCPLYKTLDVAGYGDRLFRAYAAADILVVIGLNRHGHSSSSCTSTLYPSIRIQSMEWTLADQCNCRTKWANSRSYVFFPWLCTYSWPACFLHVVIVAWLRVPGFFWYDDPRCKYPVATCELRTYRGICQLPAIQNSTRYCQSIGQLQRKISNSRSRQGDRAVLLNNRQHDSTNTTQCLWCTSLS